MPQQQVAEARDCWVRASKEGRDMGRLGIPSWGGSWLDAASASLLGLIGEGGKKKPGAGRKRKMAEAVCDGRQGNRDDGALLSEYVPVGGPLICLVGKEE